MAKIKLGPTTDLFPMPAVLVAVKTGEGSANVLTIAWAGIVGGSPPMMALEIGRNHYSTPYIEREGSFSVNIPSTRQVVGTDYCGIVSGSKDPDKPATCGWTMVPATKISSPLIAECPLNMECRVAQRIEAGRAVFYVAEILETHVDEEALVDGEIDARRLDPLIFGADSQYYALGERVAKAFEVGKQLRK